MRGCSEFSSSELNLSFSERRDQKLPWTNSTATAAAWSEENRSASGNTNQKRSRTNVTWIDSASIERNTKRTANFTWIIIITRVLCTRTISLVVNWSSSLTLLCNNFLTHGSVQFRRKSETLLFGVGCFIYNKQTLSRTGVRPQRRIWFLNRRRNTNMCFYFEISF